MQVARKWLVLWVGVVAVAVGCGVDRHEPAGGGTATVVEPVAECVAYEDAVAGCYHRRIAIASQPSLLPHDLAEAAAIRDVCRQNLERFRTACR